LISLLEIFDQNTTPSWLTQQNDSLCPKSKQGILSIYGLPAINPKGKSDFLISFMGIEVPVHGPEMLAKDMKTSFCKSKKKKEATMKPL
jgi:hypothetical protein